MLAIKRTILVKLQFSRSISPIFFSSVILLFALGALQGDLLNRPLLLTASHSKNSLPVKYPAPLSTNDRGIQPSIGFEPMTPTLPWWCSAS